MHSFSIHAHVIYIYMHMRCICIPNQIYDTQLNIYKYRGFRRHCARDPGHSMILCVKLLFRSVLIEGENILCVLSIIKVHFQPNDKRIYHSKFDDV